MAFFCSPAISPNPSVSFNFIKIASPQLLIKSYLAPNLHATITNSEKIFKNGGLQRNPLLLQCKTIRAAALASETEEVYSSTEEYSDEEEGPPSNGQTPPPVKRRRRRYRKQYPGEANGITEEMRFVAMKLRNNGKSKSRRTSAAGIESDGEERAIESEKEKQNVDGTGETWQPSIEGLLKYFVDKWLKEQGNEIPEPSNPGVTYMQYLQELAERSPPLFLCHFYNIYFSHIAGGQVIARKVSDMLFEGRELEINKWDGDAEELLRGVREKLNALGEHWSRDEKNRCLRETTKAFRFLGQILRLIIL